MGVLRALPAIYQMEKRLRTVGLNQPGLVAVGNFVQAPPASEFEDCRAPGPIHEIVRVVDAAGAQFILSKKHSSSYGTATENVAGP